MRKLIVFNHVSLDGYFVDKNGDMSWAKADHQDAEWDAFVAGNASGGGVLVLQDYLRDDGKLLADTVCDREYACCGRRNE